MTPSLIQFDKKRLGASPGLCGVDEAGRGCLAGPVVAAAVWADAKFYDSRMRVRLASAINDSKQLSADDREELLDLIAHWQTKGVLRFSPGEASVLEIAGYNILGATKLAMGRALKALADAAPGGHSPFTPHGEKSDPLFATGRASAVPVLVDGKPLKPFAWEHDAIVGGDAKSLVIAMASIVAKVTRDRACAHLDKAYPLYGFGVHKGYATPEHVLAIHRHGPCPEHRALFIRNILDGGKGASVASGVAEDDQSEFGF